MASDTQLNGVVAREDHGTTLSGQLMGATEPLNLELNQAMLPWFLPGDFWFVGILALEESLP